MTAPSSHAAERARPSEVTLATCIGCGAMNLAGNCPSGCADERRLELVPAEELEALAAVVDRVAARAASLRADVDALAALSDATGNCAEEVARAREALAVDGESAARLHELVAQPLEPTVSWWCPECGGIDAPQPCIGICIRRPARWANAERIRAVRARAIELLAVSDGLAGVLSVIAHTRPRPGQEQRHWEAVRRRAAAASGVAAAQPGAIQSGWREPETNP